MPIASLRRYYPVQVVRVSSNGYAAISVISTPLACCCFVIIVNIMVFKKSVNSRFEKGVGLWYSNLGKYEVKICIAIYYLIWMEH